MSQFDAAVQAEQMNSLIESMRLAQESSEREIAELRRDAKDRAAQFELLHGQVSNLQPPRAEGHVDDDDEVGSQRSERSRGSSKGQYSQHGIGARAAMFNPSPDIVLWHEGKSMEVESPELRHWRVETTKALGSCRVFKFTGKYWSQWKSCVISALQAVKLEHLLLNNFQLGDESTPGDVAEYQATQTCARNFIYMYLSTELISDLNGVSDVFGIWKRLRDTYENRGVKQWTHIFDSWSSHTQGSMPMEQYIREEEDFVERLKSLGRTFGDDLDDLRVHFFMKGLHSRYETQAAVYEFMEKPYDVIIAQFRSLALQKEGRKQQQFKAEANASTFGTGKQKKKGALGSAQPPAKRCFKCGELGHLSAVCSVSLPLDTNNNPLPLCFQCKEHGHMSPDCPKKKKAIVPTK
jgi:hypothetical protein